MRKIIKPIVFQPQINWILSRFLKPFSKVLPSKVKIPVHGFHQIKVNKNTRFSMEAHYTSHLSRLLFWDGIRGFEYGSVRVFTELIKSSNVFLDIGANVGYYSLLASKINKDISVYAFEPFPDSVKAMQRNVTKNGAGNISIISLALSDEEGDTEFFYKIHPGFPGQELQLSGDNSLVNFKMDDRKTIKVKQTTLDRYLSENIIRHVDLMKIDTETTEHRVLRGAEHTVKKFRPIILCEVIKNFNEKLIEQFFGDMDYRFYKIEPNQLMECTSICDLQEEKNDFFFVPPEKHTRVQAFL